ncbi:ankyrin [Tuber magnatum]|uniref:Ankyrin n=1 Tax=Tuber magnatum TaxID=42249 RepID=A0A317SG85_9PEZI|nr:ankyrin [Tuber magnatum]
MWDRTPLILAVESGNLDAVRALLETGEVDVNAEDTWDRTALWIAARNGCSDIARALLGRKDIEVNPHQKYWGFNEPETPLAIACYYGHAPVVQEFLADGRVNLNARDKEGLTPVHLSVSNFRSNVLSLLLAQPSIDALAPCDRGHTPLHTAAVRGNLNALRQLLQHPHLTDPNIMTEDNWTPLGLAARFGRDGIVRALVDDGRVDINGIAGAGETALVLAAKRMRWYVVEELLEADGVDVHRRGAEDGMSFAEIVEAGNNPKLKRLLDEKVRRECQ